MAFVEYVSLLWPIASFGGVGCLGGVCVPLVALYLRVSVLWSCLKLDTWEFAQACTGSVTTLRGPLVDRGFPLGGKARGQYGGPSGSLECLVPPHRSNGDVAPLGVNFGIHRRLLVHRLLLNPSSLPMRFTL